MLEIMGMPTYTLGSVACPDTAWGRQVIKDVDQALDKLKPAAVLSTTRFKPIISWKVGV